MQSPDTEPAPAARVLVVDDDPALTATLAQVLTSEGYLVDVAQDGAAALERAHEHRPTVVLLDLHMPVLDGHGFLERFRAMPGCADVPVVLMTGHEDTGTVRQRIGPAGVVLLLPKPLDLDDLLVALQGMARLQRRQEQ
jgi:CheY-like chemotaxis protein